MGCMCSVPTVKDSERRGCSVNKSLSSSPVSTTSMSQRRPSEKDSETPGLVMSIEELFTLATETTEQFFKTTVESVMLTAIIIVESSGDTVLTQWRDDFEEMAYGLGQMLYSTAQNLFHSGYTVYNLSNEQDLYEPKVAMYFAGAYLEYLSKENPESSGEFLVKAYHNGMGYYTNEMSLELWKLYSRASSQLFRLKTAMNCEEYELKNIHIVQPGENLNIIAKICRLDLEDILQCNPDLKEANSVQTGDCIELPVQKSLPRLYAVKTGDTLDSIAYKHDVSPIRLLKSNVEIKSLGCLKQGWVLSVPGLKGTSTNGGGGGGLGHDIMNTGMEDGPFVLSTTAVVFEEEEEEEEEEIMSPELSQNCSSFSRDYFRRCKGSRNGTTSCSSIGKLISGIRKRTS
eukprot:g9046.t1